MVEAERSLRRTRIGVVVSDKMDKTVVVSVERKVSHPLYGRIMRKTTNFKAHDESNKCSVGDQVRIMETRPISKDKRWRVTEIVDKAR